MVRVLPSHSRDAALLLCPRNEERGSCPTRNLEIHFNWSTGYPSLSREKAPLQRLAVACLPHQGTDHAIVIGIL